MIFVVPNFWGHGPKNVARRWVVIRKTINGRSMEYNKGLGDKGIVGCCLI